MHASHNLILFSNLLRVEEEGMSETDNVDINDLDKEDYDGADPFADPDEESATPSSPSSTADKGKGKEDSKKKASGSSKKHSHSKQQKDAEPKAPSESSDGTEVASLKSSLSSLEDSVEDLSEKLKAAKSENAALKKQIEKLEASLKDTKKAGKKSKQPQQHAVCTVDAEEVDALRSQIAALSSANSMTLAMYESAIGAEFVDGAPRAATKMREWLCRAGALESSSDPSRYEPIFRCVQPLYNALADDYFVPFYWVSTYSALLCSVAGVDRLGPRITQVAEDAQKGLVGAIEGELYESFLAALCSCYKHLSECTKIAPCDSSSSSSPQVRAHEIIGAIAAVLKSVEKACLPDGVRVQVCEHLVACVDADVFNELVSRPELCTCGMGLQIREALGEIEDFLRRDPLVFQTKRLLAHIREASCLFIMDKNILNDDDAIKSVITVLNYRQVARLLENFHEDQFCATKVDAPILQLMRGRARTSESADLMLDPHKFIC